MQEFLTYKYRCRMVGGGDAELLGRWWRRREQMRSDGEGRRR